MVYNLSEGQSIVTQWMSEIRDVEIQQDRMRFRRNLERIAEVAAIEISKELEYKEQTIVTPMGEKPGNVLAAYPVLTTILRAGVPMHQGLLHVFDKADCGFVAAFRKHHRDGSFEISAEYFTCPPLAGRVLILADPMLATGASLVVALKGLMNYGRPARIHIVTAIACTQGIDYVLRHFPDVDIWVGDVDEELTAKGYIVPGLGDAGDLAYGSKEQD